MRIAVLPADSAGCAHYRLLYPADALAKQGADIVIDRKGPQVLWQGPHQGEPGADHVAHGLAEEYPADVVVIQRPGRRWWSDLIPHFQAQGTRVVVDVDDLLDQIPRGNSARASLEGNVNSHRWVDKACQLADLVTCTTPALLKRYGWGHGVVLPNLVPESMLSVTAEKRPRTIGWPGFVGTHPGDLDATEGAVEQVLSSNKEWSFHAVGDGSGVRKGLRLRNEPTATGGLPFDAYPSAVAQLEIGIVPLRQSEFNRAKSALKVSEMAALAVPVVLSPTPDNLRLHALGVGVTAGSRSQWRRQLTRLVVDDKWRDWVSERGRSVMAGQTYEIHADKWADAWMNRALVSA